MLTHIDNVVLKAIASQIGREIMRGRAPKSAIKALPRNGSGEAVSARTLSQVRLNLYQSTPTTFQRSQIVFEKIVYEPLHSQLHR